MGEGSQLGVDHRRRGGGVVAGKKWMVGKRRVALVPDVLVLTAFQFGGWPR